MQSGIRRQQFSLVNIGDRQAFQDGAQTAFALARQLRMHCRQRPKRIKRGQRLRMTGNSRYHGGDAIALAGQPFDHARLHEGHVGGHSENP